MMEGMVMSEDMLATMLIAISIMATGIGLWLKLHKNQKRQDEIANRIYDKISEGDNRLFELIQRVDARQQEHEKEVAKQMVTRRELPDIIRATAQAFRMRNNE